MTEEKASAVSSGSTNVSLAWISVGGTTGTIGSNTVPAAWSSLKASSGPNRRTKGARAAAARGPTRSNPISRRFGQHIGGQAQRLDREIRHDVRTRRHHTATAKPSDRMRDGRRVGDGGTGGQTLAVQPRHQIAQQPCLAAMQMRAAGDVDPQAVRRIGRRQRRVAQAPSASRVSAAASPRIRVMHRKPGHQRLRLRQLHPGRRPRAGRAPLDHR